MKHISIVSTLAALVAALTAPTANAQNLVTNPGFETGDFIGWTTTPAASGSLFIVAPGFGNTGAFGAGFGASNFQVDTISQVLSTTPGASYTLSFFVQNLATGDDFFSTTWDGNETVIFEDSAATFPYTQFSFNVTATGANTTIAFSSYDAPDGILLDDVSVTANAAVVPEAGSLALALAGVALAAANVGVAIVRRKRNA